MTRLTEWLPFRFNRSSQEKKLPIRHESDTSLATPWRTGMVPWMGSPEQMMRAMDQMFEAAWRDPLAPLKDMDRWFGDWSSPAFHPRVDVADEGTHLRVTAELPGMDANDVEISVTEGSLVLRGEKKSEVEKKDEGWYHVERSYGRFERAVPLPSDVDADKAEAKFKNGVLTVRIPKIETQASTRRIPIESQT